ncbi:MAG: bifunctional precorrin-2 dehydrogenase/sirohydrochlorin ferrochelatase [Candidatus Omnitrophota bacterium]|nr:bifunctional precorrin-2 dehydrogenase/sirohydrochlorin ferrochelatase [Candidatus Omnitrophota bacterium]
MNYYPVNLNLENKRCLVAGAGRVAERKVRRLLECGAQVLVVSPEITPFLKTLAEKRKIIFKKRRVNLTDLNGVYLAISATGDRKINSLISSYCHRKGILVNVVDSPKECNFILPSVARRGSLTIAVSTDGMSPALSKKIRRDLEQRFGAEYAKLLRLMAKLRPEVFRKIKNSKARKAFFQKVIQADILNLLKKNKERQAREKIRAILDNAGL